jgi:hypothetical protein
MEISLVDKSISRQLLLEMARERFGNMVREWLTSISASWRLAAACVEDSSVRDQIIAIVGALVQ